MAENNPFPGENNTGHIWDDNLRELENPPPRWWMIAFWASILFFFGYGILYPFWPGIPGLYDTTRGLLGWTQIDEYQKGVEQVEGVRSQYEDQIKGMTAEQIMADPGLTQYTLASAKVLFGDYCSACHGSGGQGNPGFPVLADDDWLFGGTVAKIQESITIGRKGAMTAHKDILSEAEVDALANLTVSLSEGQPGSEEEWNLFNAKGCTACHGQKGDGILAEMPDGSVVTVGAANLTDGIWRFEPGGYESAKHTIMYGVNQPGVDGSRDGVMPGFGDSGKLGEQEIKKLVVYVHQFGGGE
ncbi:MAG: cytochrome-c oxidase, cbb3-type subunit III [Pseudomonadota bacterium]|nr:cytochrome-c oxidase, cbb3-type subunit III [Pseudomonadota bacterium]